MPLSSHQTIRAETIVIPVKTAGLEEMVTVKET